MSGDLDFLTSSSIVQEAKDLRLRVSCSHLFGHMVSIAVIIDGDAIGQRLPGRIA